MTATEPLHLTGHCYCGGIRYAVDLPAGQAPIFTAWCHCDSCRRAHAAPLYQVACVEASAFRFTAGEELLQDFAKSERGIVRAFCSRCGTRMLNRFPAWKPKGKVAVAFFPNTLDAPLQHPFAAPLRPVHHAHADECVLDAAVLAAMGQAT